MTPSRIVRITVIPAVVCLAAAAFAAEDRVGVYRADGSRLPAQQAAALARRLADRGTAVTTLNDRQLCEPGRLAPRSLEMLVVCDGSRMPAPAVQSLAEYVAGGGKLMMLGGPFLTDVAWPYRGQFLSRAELIERAKRELTPTVFADFEAPALGGWQHTSDNPQSKSTARRVAGGAENSQGAMLLDLSNISSWETFAAPKLEQPLPPGHTWTTFWAKGESTRGAASLMLEWRERDGSRWIAVVPLTDRWQFFALPPEAFGFWVDSSSRGRGGPGDAFHPENAETIVVGLAHSHAEIDAKAHYRIWIDRIGAAAPPAELKPFGAMFTGAPAMPVIEAVSPAYKLYPVTNAKQVRVNPGQAIAGAFAVPQFAATHAPHPRPLGTSLDRRRPGRFVPLVECLDAQGLLAGAAASLSLAGENPSKGGMVAAVPVTDHAFFASAAVQDWLADLAARMLDGVFLYEGGARFYASFGGETMPVGAVVSNRGNRASTTTVRAAVGEPGGKTIWRHEWTVDVPAGQSRRVAADWQIAADAPDRMTVAVELLRNGRVIDRLDHQLRIWRPKARPQFMAARQGGFYLGDTPWYAHGVNYMASSGIGAEDFHFFANWLSAESYDPAVVDRDLARLKALGLNCVSVFLDHSGLAARNLRDLLMRCEDYGLKVNLSLRPGTPLDFPWEKIREMIVAERLAENDTVIAYDLAWEPMWGRRNARRRFDSLWLQWIDKKHGSLAAAEKAWGFAVPREDGRAAGPSDQQVSGDGPWRGMVIDYRRFLNELLDERYGRARQLVRSIDPNHPVSFRMTIAGDPTVHPSEMAYDMAGLARAVDIMEPEGYGRIGDWDKVRPGRFTVAYARALAPELPVLWAEFGYTVWNASQGRPSDERMAFTAKFYDDFYKMAHQSGANGTIAWYSAGGYRVDEKSDFGILNPDGSWRPISEVIHRWSGPMTRPRPVPKPDVLIPIQLARDADGLAGIYRRVQKQFWQAVDAGRTPGLVVEKPTPAKR